MDAKGRSDRRRESLFYAAINIHQAALRLQCCPPALPDRPCPAGEGAKKQTRNLRQREVRRGKIAARDAVPRRGYQQSSCIPSFFIDGRKMSRKGLSAIVALLALISAQAPVRAY